MLAKESMRKGPRMRSMGQRARGAVLGCVLMLASSWCPGQAWGRLFDESIRGAGRLSGTIREVLDDPALQDARISLLVRDLDQDRDLFVHKPLLALNPASGTKVITGSALLSQLGGAYTFVTKVQGLPPDRGAIASDLVLVGGGDPLLRERDLWALTQQLADLGLREVRGDLVLDHTRYDDRIWPPAYEQKGSDAAYQAPVAALAVGFSALRIRVLPGIGAGKAARVSVSPRGAPLTIDNRITTRRGRGARLSVSVVQGRNGDIVRLRGRIGRKHRGKLFMRRATRPVALAGGVFRELLSRAGIVVRGQTRQGRSHEGLKTLAEHRSLSLGILVALMNKHSNNFMAEMLLKELSLARGAEQGSSEEGARALMAFFRERGLPSDGMVLRNGSGLYDANRVSARGLVALLQDMADDPLLGPEFISSLAVAGVDGTLLHRFAERETRPAVSRVRAKSGTLARAISLSGYVWAADSTRLAFACLIEDFRSLAGARRALDRIGALLARYERGSRGAKK